MVEAHGWLGMGLTSLLVVTNDGFNGGLYWFIIMLYNAKNMIVFNGLQWLMMINDG